MALLQISEPGQSPAPHTRRLAVGIDLGTTNSLVATVRSGLAETLPDEDGRHLLPSVVRYLSDGAVAVGPHALDAAVIDPLNTIASVKRLIGRGIDDVKTLGERLPYRFVPGESGMPAIHTVVGVRSPVEISAEILRVLKQRAEVSLGGELHGAVITVPAYFDDAQRQATKDAARLAGLPVLRLLSEPTAAAVAYGLDHDPDGIYAVYDLGGGTFDISILRMNRGVFEVLATAGDSALGGDDFDHAIADWMLARSDNVVDPGDLRRLLRDARNVKEQLSTDDEATVAVGKKILRMTRVELHTLVDPLVDKTAAPCRRVLRDAGIQLSEIREVVMVGGSTRMPRVRERVAQIFQREPLIDIDPDKVVAIGAAVQANILVGNKPDAEMLLLDVTPLSLGIEIMGGMVEKIIPRNSPIPIAKAQAFTTFKDGQTAIAIHVLQGERELIGDNRSLARFELRGIPPMAAGAARIRVTFQVDADGLLSVAAHEETSGVAASVTVKPSYGLSDPEIERILRESITHAHADVAARNSREQQVEADRVLEALAAALAVDAHLLSAAERERLEFAMKNLRTVRAGDDHLKIKQAIAKVDSESADFAARRMDRSIRQAMTGHRLDEFK